MSVNLGCAGWGVAPGVALGVSGLAFSTRTSYININVLNRYRVYIGSHGGHACFVLSRMKKTSESATLPD